MPLPSGRNPWLTIWTDPRATLREILDTDPKQMVLLLAMVGGFVSTLDRASIKNLGDHLPLLAILGGCAVLWPLAGLTSLYMAGFLLKWTGRWIGGQATSEQIRAALAWSSVPVIWTSILFIPELALFGKEIFTSETPRIDANPSLGIALMAFGAVEIVLGIWAFVIFLKCLGEAQRFSAWKSLGNSTTAFLVVLIPLIVIVIGVTGLAKLR